MIDQATRDELVALRADARLAAESYTDAIAAQAEKHDVSRSALRRYVNALEADRLADLDTEATDLANLMETMK